MPLLFQYDMVPHQPCPNPCLDINVDDGHNDAIDLSDTRFVPNEPTVAVPDQLYFYYRMQLFHSIYYSKQYSRPIYAATHTTSVPTKELEK